MMNVPLTLNAEFIESQYRRWKSDPNTVTRDWRFFFEGFELARISLPEGDRVSEEDLLKQTRVVELIERYRDLGHLLACLDPLVQCPTEHPLLELKAFDLSEEDLDRVFHAPNMPEVGVTTLREIVTALRETYCRSIGVEYSHLQDPHEREWLRKRMEPTRNRPALDAEARVRLLNKLMQATLFEQFLHARYTGQKRFSVEGAEAVVPMLDGLLHHVAEKGCQELVLGMAHRGRLNVQVNVLGKLYETVFCEFEDHYDPTSLYGSGDVKYHGGYFGEVQIGDYPLRVLLVNNPSHLEAVNPVVEGIVRARQEQLDDHEHRKVLPILVHGDAAFSGQGIVAETLNLSQLEGYHTGGTVHIVINNQIGFTTLPEDARSTRYSTDIAKMLMVPIFHVHGEDPEAAVHVARLAADYRMEFGKDVVIDLVGYRRHGHNEGDEPYYTQPLMYKRISSRPSIYDVYAQSLIKEKLVTEEDLGRNQDEINGCLEEAYKRAHERTCAFPEDRFYESWEYIERNYSHEPIDTGVEAEVLRFLGRGMHSVPEGFSVHRRLRRILDRRLEAVETGKGIDWATAELLAFASLLREGIPIRLSGQDSRRGTFSQRHSVLVDTETGEHYTPLKHLSDGQADFQVWDSMLSEEAVLGFEYGYSLATPNTLTLWEAQFGDFANNAQAIIDQFIAGGEAKWHRLSGLVMLLPHGFEGQGPEHSSARLERYLQLSAENNIQVCQPTTPAQHFHLLRRQVLRKFRKPLVEMTPKSLLRHPLAVSSLQELSTGSFREVLDDDSAPDTPKRVLLCSGKIYYDLLERRQATEGIDVAIVRIEQLYPFPRETLSRILSRYGSAEEWVWVQDEPQNMGAWNFIRYRLEGLLQREIGYVGRAASASTATGYYSMHLAQQAVIAETALGLKERKISALQ